MEGIHVLQLPIKQCPKLHQRSTEVGKTRPANHNRTIHHRGNQEGHKKKLKIKKAAGLDDAIMAEALQGGGDTMAEALHSFCSELFYTLNPPEQWVTNAIIPLPKKDDLTQINYRGISLMSMAAKVYNKILLNRIPCHIDSILRKNQAGFRKSRSCAKQIHIPRRIMEGFQNYQRPQCVTFIDFKKAFDSIDRKVMFTVLQRYGIPEKVVNATKVLYNNLKSVVMVDGNVSDSF